MSNEQTSNVIQIFLLQNTTVNLLNSAFNNYTNNWYAVTQTVSDPLYPCLTGGTDLQTITNFQNWTWKNSRMLHVSYSGSTIDDSINQDINILSGQTYKITFDIKNNTNPNDYIYISINNSGGFITSSGDTVSGDGRYEQYLISNDTDSNNSLTINSSQNFNGSISNLTITNGYL